MSERPYFIINVEVAICDNEHYLLIRRGANEDHSPGTLSLPGGKVDQLSISPDALEQTVRREAMEEVGLKLGSLHYLESKSFVMDTGEWCLSICFYCEDMEGVARANNPDEVQELIWLKAEDIAKENICPPWTKQSIVSANDFRASLHN